MNSAFLVVIVITYIIFIFVLLYIAYRLIRHQRKIKLNKRFNYFAIELIDDENEAFFDRLTKNYQVIRNCISRQLINWKIFDTYSNKYEKYLHQSRVTDIQKMGYITDKLFIAIIGSLLFILSCIFRYQKISFSFLIMIFLIFFFAYDIFLIIREKVRNASIERDMTRAITIMNNAFKSGYSIMQAIYLVHTELNGPISEEFKKMYMDINFGLNMEVVFERFALRVPCVESKYMATSLAVVNKTGGNIVQVFNAVERNSLMRRKLKEELKSASSASRAMFRILIFIPLVLVLILLVLNPQYFNNLLTTTIGFTCLLICLFLYVLYIIIIRKIIYVEVDL